jgi:chorismate mutase
VSGGEQRLWAARGAVQVRENESEAILAATEELMGELMRRNRLEPAQLVSCLFTCTDDLDAEFPAVAARRLGLDGVPLLCAREIDVPGSMARVIRVMVHYYATAGHEPSHVYLGAAQELRSDLHSAQ